ncbi:hypothetical protein TDB9533_04457 [Thalassocella blandensis]|nr:hypothetical protein TDB9533_04457 [Thalassocella blandensis]
MKKQTQLSLWILVLFLPLFVIPMSALAEDWVYSVRKGDTLWGLCKKFTTKNDCWLRIGDYNGVKYPKTLAPATRIRFPASWLKDQPARAEVYFVIGQATKTVEDTQSTLVKGDMLGIGTTIRVGQKSTVTLQFADGAILIVSENSEVVLDTLSHYKDTGMVDSRLRLNKGDITTKVPKRTPRSRFEVTTPSAIAAVRGTEFRISSTGEMRNEVLEGEVAVIKGEQSKAVPEGFGLLVQNNDAPLTITQLLPAPAIDATQKYEPQPFTLTWQEVENAEQYFLAVFNQAGNQQLTSQTIQAADSSLPLQLSDGCYTIKLSAIDSQGFKGLPGLRTLCLTSPLPAPGAAKLETQVLSWQSVPGAAQYQLTFKNASGANNTAKKQDIYQITSSDPTFNLLHDATAKQYRYVSIAAVDAHGYPGSASQDIVLPKEERNHWRVLFVLLPALMIFL